MSYEPTATSPDELVGVIRDTGYGADVRQETFGVTGMTCASCVGRVERALEKVPPGHPGQLPGPPDRPIV